LEGFIINKCGKVQILGTKATNENFTQEKIKADYIQDMLSSYLLQKSFKFTTWFLWSET